MKNLHFYIQSVLLLVALCLAVQIPQRSEVEMILWLLQLVIGIYQLFMAFMLKMRLRQKSILIEIYLLSSVTYLFVLFWLGAIEPHWMKNWWYLAVFGLPWAFAIFFLVVIDELEYTRNYRL